MLLVTEPIPQAHVFGGLVELLTSKLFEFQPGHTGLCHKSMSDQVAIDLNQKLPNFRMSAVWADLLWLGHSQCLAPAPAPAPTLTSCPHVHISLSDFNAWHDSGVTLSLIHRFRQRTNGVMAVTPWLNLRVTNPSVGRKVGRVEWRDQDAHWHMMDGMEAAAVHGKGSAAPPVVGLALVALGLKLDQDQDQDLMLIDDECKEASDIPFVLSF
ncbi:hypothetical protein BJY52DRAFT_1229568 [Lactarius psammicola]|nr:hypothetical protein BJY52DRAFT_1229568 [Lactarius psammicola]